MTAPEKVSKPAFSGYEKFLIAILTILQFTVILDFMVLSPLGAILMPALTIDPQQFGWVVSAYAFSAGASGLLAAGFADRFDRKRMLLVFYAGFLGGTLLSAGLPLITTYCWGRASSPAFLAV
jgi:predicted MFS family arabinose efflux permease